jgi:Flp pilus assembly protein TadB
VLDLFLQSAQLFLRGKLFRSPLHVAQRAAIGVVITALSCVVLVKLMGALWLAVLLSALLGGALQPWLFKDLKYN